MRPVFGVALTVLCLCATPVAAGGLTPAGGLDAFAAAHPGAVVMLDGTDRFPRMITGLSVPVSPGDEGAVRAFVDNWSSLFGVDPVLGGLDLETVSEFDDAALYRYRHVHAGLPVEGGEVVAGVYAGRIVHVTNGVKAVTAVTTGFLVDRDDARRAALADAGESAAEVSTSAVLLPRGGGFIPAYRVETTSHGHGAHYRHYVDGRTGTVLWRVDLVKRARANVFMDSPELSGSTVEVDLADLTSPSYLRGSFADVYSNCKPGLSCDDTKRLAKADAAGDFLFQPAEPDENDPFAEVMAYYHMNRAHAWFVGIGASQMDFVVKAAVNATNVLLGVTCNSGYDNGAVLMGICRATDLQNTLKKTVNFAYDADIVIHEYAHGYVDKTSKLVGTVDDDGLNVMADALNEGTADLVGGFVTGDGVQGRHSLAALGADHVRDMTAFYACPEDLSGEGHRDSRIFSTATWAGYEASGRDPAAGKAVALGVASLTSASTFEDAAAAVASFAKQTGGDPLAATFSAAYDEQGLSTCGRLVDVPNGFKAGGHLVPLLNPGLGQYQPHMVQYVYTVTAGATSATAEMTGAGGNVAWYVNQGGPVKFADANTTATYRWSSNPSETIQNPPPGKYHMLVVFEGANAVDWSFRFTAQGPQMPAVVSMAPGAARRGETVPDVEVKGTGFLQGATVTLPHGLRTAATEFVDSKTLRVHGLSVSARATVGAKDVYVYNPDGSSAIGAGLFVVEEGEAPDAGADASSDAAHRGDAGPQADVSVAADGGGETAEGGGGGCSCSTLM